MGNKFKQGDKVYYNSNLFDSGRSGPHIVDYYDGEIYQGRTKKVVFTTGNWMPEDRLFLAEPEGEWSDWESGTWRNHSRYYYGCDYEEVFTRVNGFAGMKSRIKLPKRKKLSEFSGTVEVNADGSPNLSTYRE